MKRLTWLLWMVVAAGCANDQFSQISIQNQTEVPIFAQPFTSGSSDSDWIPPGGIDEFYSINSDCLDAFEYFTFYYDSLVVILQDHEDEPVKFYPDGTTVNYDPALNPFVNPRVWRTRELEAKSPEQRVYEHYVSISGESIQSLQEDTGN